MIPAAAAADNFQNGIVQLLIIGGSQLHWAITSIAHWWKWTRPRSWSPYCVTWYAQLSEWCAENRKWKLLTWSRVRDVQKDHGLGYKPRYSIKVTSLSLPSDLAWPFVTSRGHQRVLNCTKSDRPETGSYSYLRNIYRPTLCLKKRTTLQLRHFSRAWRILYHFYDTY